MTNKMAAFKSADVHFGFYVLLQVFSEECMNKKFFGFTLLVSLLVTLGACGPTGTTPDGGATPGGAGTPAATPSP
jgi:hypothetical protein